MADESQTSSTGETTSNFLEKITPKDLVMFSPETRKVIAKSDFNFLDNEYNIQLPSEEDLNKIRVWGLPYVKLTDPVPFGLLAGFTTGALFNIWRRRPTLNSVHLHLASSFVFGLGAKLFHKKLQDYRVERELVVWDYVKKHPQDFPEVFNAPKKYKDMLLTWNPNR